MSRPSLDLAPGSDEAAILQRFGIGPDALLGSGSESRVFALDADRVLRISFGSLAGEQTEGLQHLLEGLAAGDIGVATPRTLDRGRLGSQEFRIDQRIPGRSLASWLETPRPEAERQRALLGFAEVAGRVAELPVAGTGFRSPAFGDRYPAGASLVDLLRGQAERGLAESQGKLAAAVPDLDARLVDLFDRLADRQVAPALVHADYFPGNVMIDGDQISGVVDFSVHSLIADPVLDLVGAACLLEHTNYPQAASDSRWLTGVITEQLGPLAWLVPAYSQWYAAYYSMDHTLIGWAARQFLSS